MNPRLPEDGKSGEVIFWMNRPLKIAVLTNRLPPYRRPIFEELNSDRNLEFRLFLSSPSAVDDEGGGVPIPTVRPLGINIFRKTRHTAVNAVQKELLHIPLGLPVHLLAFRPHVIISGEFGLRSLMALGIAKVLRAPLVLWSEEIRETAASISWLQQRSRNILFRNAAAMLAWGSPAVEYLRSKGIPDSKIYYCAQAVDNNYWTSQISKYPKQEIQSQLELSGKVYLVVGRLVSRKGVANLLEAWAEMPADFKANTTLLIVGDGEEAPTLRGIVRTHDLQNVVFAGSQSPSTLPKYYAASDIFVFPSLVDVWGLVVNEAMAAGLPVLGSKYAGASQELIQDETVGELIDPLNKNGLKKVLQRWNEKNISTPNASSQARISQINFSVTVQAIRRMITDVLKVDIG